MAILTNEYHATCEQDLEDEFERPDSKGECLEYVQGQNLDLTGVYIYPTEDEKDACRANGGTYASDPIDDGGGTDPDDGGGTDPDDGGGTDPDDGGGTDPDDGGGTDPDDGGGDDGGGPSRNAKIAIAVGLGLVAVGVLVALGLKYKSTQKKKQKQLEKQRLISEERAKANHEKRMKLAREMVGII